MNKMLLIYKVTALGTVIIALLMGILAFYHSAADPVVVLEKCGEKVFYQGERTPLKITDDDVKSFIENWVKLRYTWSEFDPEKIVQSISPLSTEGFQEKLKLLLGKKKADNTKDQKIEESVANIRVSLTDKDAIASFDQILRINGIPLIVPFEVSLQIVQGSQTRWNPLGLYVNGVIEHEEK